MRRISIRAMLILWFLCAAASVGLSQLILRELSHLLAFHAELSAIFLQIESACILPPLWAILPGSALLSWLCCRILRRKTALRWVAAVLLLLVCGILGVSLSVLLSRVNGIVLFDVLRTLLPLLEMGVL